MPESRCDAGGRCHPGTSIARRDRHRCWPDMRGVLHDLALPTFRRFADRWGYEVHAAEVDEDGEGASESAQAAKWLKVVSCERLFATIRWRCGWTPTCW